MAKWRLKEGMDRFLALATASERPVLPMYHRQRTLFDSTLRQWILLAVLGLCGIIYGWYFVIYGPFMMQYLLVPILLMAMLVIWALPDQVNPPVRAMEKFYWGFWITLIAWPNYLALALPGLPWITVNRLFGIPMLLMLLIALSVSKPFRTRMSETMNALPLMGKAMVGFVCCQVLSTVLSGHYGETVSRFVNLQIIWTNIFFVSIYVFSRPGRIEKWVRIIILLGVFLGLMSLVETSLGRIIWRDHIPPFLKVNDPSVIRVLQGSFRNGYYRVVGPYMSSLSMAEFLALASPFTLHAAVSAKRFWHKVPLIAADVLLLFAIYFTHARLGMVGFLLSHSIYGLYWGVRRWMTHRASIMGPALTLGYPAILLAIGLAVATIGPIRVMVLGDQQQEASNLARQQQYALAPDRIMANPLGYGPDRSGIVLGFVNPGGEASIDTYYISMVLDYGVMGFLLFYGMVVLALFKSAKISSVAGEDETSYALPVSIALGAFLVIKSVLSQEANNPIMFMLLAMVTAMAYHQKRREASQAEAANPPA